MNKTNLVKILEIVLFVLIIVFPLKPIFAFVFLPYDYGFPSCKQPPGCGQRGPQICYNDYAVGVSKCGPACQGGETWSKYEFTNKCVEHPITGCSWLYLRSSSWMSTADKLQPNCPGCGSSKNGYLAAGTCNPSNSGSFYKVCCTSNGNVGASGPYFLQDAYNPPTEGVCTQGSPKIISGPFDIPSGQPHPACGGAPQPSPSPPPPPPPPPPPSVSGGGLCEVRAFASASPSIGGLRSDFNVTYGIRTTPPTFTYTCTSPTSTITRTTSASCSGTVNVRLNLTNITKPWGGTKSDSFSHSFTTSRLNDSQTVTFSETSLYGRPKYHGDYNFSVDVSGAVSGRVSFPCPSGYSSPSPRTVGVSFSNFSGKLFTVNPTDVVSQPPTFSSNPPHPTSVITQLRSFITKFPINFNYKITFNPPRIFKADDGQFWLRIRGPENLDSNRQPIQNHQNEVSATYTWTPQIAGDYTFSVCHDADDERNIAPNEECISRDVTVYRYLCYQGFCWECSKEPSVTGGIVNLQSGNCKSVESIKCSTYIGSDCKAKGRE